MPSIPGRKAPSRRQFGLAAALGAAALWGHAAQAAGPGITVAVAANMQPAFDALLVQFALAEQARQPAGSAPAERIVPSYGSSGNLVRQIQQGLPAALFLAADEHFAQRLTDAGLTQGPGVVYATGQLALVTAPGSTLRATPDLGGLREGLARLGKFAIANPDIAPYGAAAREALQKQGLWQALAPRLVLGDNIAQAAQFVASGAADAGITAYSLTVGAAAARFAQRVQVAPDLYTPLRQRMVLLQHAPATAQRLYAFLQSPAARALLQDYGFSTK